jgi:pimeloyl-ACP methyl ester carboxylesterase
VSARFLERITYDRLPQIGAPTLVIAGGDDELVPSANSPILAQRIPGAELVASASRRLGGLLQPRAGASGPPGSHGRAL